MSFNPYDQARDDARSGRGLTPGADEGVYWAERNAREANQRAREELERRGNPGSLPSSPDGDWTFAPAPSSRTPEQAQAGLMGCATLPLLVVLSPLLGVLYPVAAIAGLVAGYVAWQVNQMVSPGGSAFTGLVVVLVALIGVALGLKGESRLARVPGYKVLRFPVRLLLFVPLLLTLLANSARGAACLGPIPRDIAEFLPLARGYYTCLLGQPSNLLIVVVGTALFALALRSEALRALWHRWFRALAGT